MHREWGSRDWVLQTLEDTGPKDGYLKSRTPERECFLIIDLWFITFKVWWSNFMRLPEFIRQINSSNSGMLVWLYPLLMCFICMTADVPSKAINGHLVWLYKSFRPSTSNQQKDLGKSERQFKVIWKTALGCPPLKIKQHTPRVTFLPWKTTNLTVVADIEVSAAIRSLSKSRPRPETGVQLSSDLGIMEGQWVVGLWGARKFHWNCGDFIGGNWLKPKVLRLSGLTIDI